MAVCWLSARTCNPLPSSLCFSWCVSSRTQLRLCAATSEVCESRLLSGGICFPFFSSLATVFHFLATRHCSSQSMVTQVAEGLPPAQHGMTRKFCAGTPPSVSARQFRRPCEMHLPLGSTVR
jgi:hypothetical protein